MKTYKNLYPKLCSLENLEVAFQKARKRKSKKRCVNEFEKNLNEELSKLHIELASYTYEPKPLKRFIVRDPKTRTIHASSFRDRVVYHALVNVLEPIFEKIFIYDSFASRKTKGTLKAIQRFDKFKRKVAKNGLLVNNSQNNNAVQGYIFKADIKHYFETVDHEILLSIIKKRIADKHVLCLVKKILENFETRVPDKGMPLGNLTSQFFANVYLNELDQYVKQQLNVKWYIRYVDDFVIIHNQKLALERYKDAISGFLQKTLVLELHPHKSKIIPLKQGINFLGFKIFYHHKRVKQANLRKMRRTLYKYKECCHIGQCSYDKIYAFLQGWCAYAMHGNTYRLRRNLAKELENEFQGEIATVEINYFIRNSKKVSLLEILPTVRTSK